MVIQELRRLFVTSFCGVFLWHSNSRNHENRYQILDSQNRNDNIFNFSRIVFNPKVEILEVWGPGGNFILYKKFYYFFYIFQIRRQISVGNFPIFIQHQKTAMHNQLEDSLCTRLVYNIRDFSKWHVCHIRDFSEWHVCM